MKNLGILNTVTRTFHQTGFQVKKHSPEILIVAGVVGTVASAVMACKATLKVNDILEETKTQVEQVKTVIADETIPEEKYSEEDGKKDLAIIYAQTGLKFVKLYGPAVILGALSITSILASNNILRKRNIALAAAYTAVDTSFKEYRNRVVERFGKELDRELRYNIKAKEIEEKTINPETGEEETTTKIVQTADKSAEMYSDYARCYDAGCVGWVKDAEKNLYFLKCQQRYANDLLQIRGWVTLNDVYDMLGFPRSQAGQVVGWVYDKDNPQGDNYIDFGIYDLHKEGCRDFVNGFERSIWLDFNVDGYIFDKIKDRTRSR